MFDNLETLITVHKCGTVSRAASRLGLTQSAVSKRIQNLGHQLGHPLLEPSGRGIVLTPYALHLVERVHQSFSELKDALSEEVTEARGQLIVALSGALLLGWGAKVLNKVRKECPNIIFSISTHRNPVAVARVRSGDCMCAVVHGMSELTPDLGARYIVDETFVIVPSELKPFKFPKKGTVKLLTVESHSETWSVMERRMKRGAAKWGIEFEVENSLQNFMGVTQLARAGFAHGLTPISVPLALGIPRNKLVFFPAPGIDIPVSLVGRRSMLERPMITQFYEALKKHVPASM